MTPPRPPDPAASGRGAPPPDGGHLPLDMTSDGTAPRGHPQAHFRGYAMRRVLLPDTLATGRDPKNDLVLDDQSVSRQHARIERTPGGFQISDLQSRGGTLVNGRRFAAHRLVIGDQIQIGPFFFRFDGTGLERTTGLTGVEITARQITKTAGTLTILDDVSLEISRGQFAAILGPSGSGKSSLLDTMTGLRPGQGGQILFDGVDFYRHYDELRSVLGYVPQDDIVHTELTVIQALRFAAQLRLPPGTPPAEIEALITQTIEQLGLTKRTHTRIARLSGGQRKRVSVGVELLGGPLVLFLDEPTSGLDPAAEFKMMALLRDLASGGRTVICTTHVMENVYLTDRIFVLASGHLIFAGGSAEAKAHFGVEALAELYDLLDDDAVAKWRQRYTAKPPPAPTTVVRPQTGAVRRGGGLATLLRRQATILAADWRNFLILLVQPMVIALLVGWVAAEPQISGAMPTSLALFFAYLSTLWFGCSNAAQEIVRELPIYRREHMVGLGRHAYLLSKFLFFGAVTGLQCVFLYVCLWVALWCGGEALRGSLLWQLAALLCTALAGVGIGFAISAFCRTTMQAVMVVPMILIPQILFSGFVVPAHEMTNAVWYPARLMPSYAAQTLVDQSIFWQQRLAPGYGKKDAENAQKGEVDIRSYYPAYNNLEIQLNPAIKRPEGALFTEAEVPKQIRRAAAGEPPFVYRFVGPGLFAVGKLLGWTLLGYAAAFFALRTKERG